MRISVNCALLHPASGGMRQYFSRLTTGLLNDARDEVTMIFPPPQTALLDELLPSSWRERAVAYDSPERVAAALRASEVYFCPFGLLTPRPAAVAAVVTLPDVQEVYHPELFSMRERWSRLYHHAASTRAAQRVITLSEFSKRCLIAAHGIPAAKITVAYPAPDEPAAAAEGRLADGLPPQFLFYPSNLWPHKNHDGLLRALATARARHGVTIPCVLTGHEVLGGFDLRAAVARYRLEQQVSFLGYVSEATMPTLYQRATALVFPSLFEGFGLPVVEAMAAGCPVVCSPHTSLPELAGDAALYVDPNDSAAMAAALVRLWTDADLRAEMVRKGREQAQRFTLTAMLEIHRRTFSQACEDFAAHGPSAETVTSRLYELLASGWQSLRARPRRLASDAG